MQPLPVSVFVFPGRLRVHTVNKCASGAISQTLAGRAFSVKPDDPGDEYRFMCVRHPLERIVSNWTYFTQTEKPFFDSQGSEYGRMGYRHMMPFDDFLDVCLEHHAENHHTRAQADFAGPFEIDHLVPLHRLNDEWEWLRASFPDLNIKPLPEGVHATSHSHWGDYYTPQQQWDAERVFARDVKLWAKALGE